MKLNTIKFSVATLLIAGCAAFAGCAEGDDFDYNKKSILITGTESNPLVKFVVEDTPSTYSITAQSTHKTEADVNIQLAIDNSLVEQYNAKNQASFFAVPDGSVELENSDVTITKGKAISSVAHVKVVSTENFEDGRTYVIPVTIKSVSTGSGEEVLEPSRTIFLKISRVLQFTSLVNNSAASSNFIFNEPVDLTNFTYEIKMRADRFSGSIQRVCAFEEKDGGNASMLRFGEAGMEANQLQWVSPAGSVPSATMFQAGRWYMVSLVYDGSSMSMYIDGVKDNSLGGSPKNNVVKFQRFELGMSWGGYRGSQYFPGRIAEVRVWNRALSPTEMANGICGVDPASDGLVAYWKMNEGEGHIFKDATQHGYDMDWNDTYRDDRENGQLVHHTDYGNYIQWVNDENNKCAQ